MLRGATVALGAVTARKVLWNVLSSVNTVACRSLWSASAPAHRRRPRPLGVVDLADLAVDAVLLEVAAAEEQRSPDRWRGSRLSRSKFLKLTSRVVVDEAALVGDDDRKAVGVEAAALDRHAQLAPHVAGEEVGLRAVAVAVLRLELDRAPRPGWPR